MKKLTLLFTLCLVSICSIAFSQKRMQCKDHPLFPNRMNDYYISKCKVNADSFQFNFLEGGNDMITKEGLKTSLRYDFNTLSRHTKPRALDIIKNYESTSNRKGGSTIFLNEREAIAVFKIMRNGQEYAWAKIQCGGPNKNEYYELTIVEIEGIKKYTTANEILTNLNITGSMPLYINFDTGEAIVKSESYQIIDQLAQMLKENPKIKIRIEGHTDNVGTPDINKKLSKNRAIAVMKELVARGIKKSRLSTKGWGQEQPLAENITEDGKAKNRRIEIVKR